MITKFMPYIPASKVRGRKMAATTDKTLITSFVRVDTGYICVASTALLFYLKRETGSDRTATYQSVTVVFLLELRTGT